MELLPLKKRPHMIAATPLPRQQSSWQQQLAEAVRDPLELCRLLALDPVRAGVAVNAFPLRVPLAFVRRMRRRDYDDPLLRQVLSTSREALQAEGYSADPLDESAVQRGGGLLQKYAHRVLLITTAACGVHCRYCFRREFPYSDAHSEGERWQQAIATVASDQSLEEVILSGGDPLSLGNARLAQLIQQLAAIPHLQRLRLHTRQPIVLPARVDQGLIEALRLWPRGVVMVLHANHANEIDAEVRLACRQLRAAGATLLNQSVLLAGVNDSADAQVALSQALWSAAVLPYYLHLLDRVRGASHFDLGETRARAIHTAMRANLPGYLLPRLVREVPGATSKVTLASDLSQA
jgi:EF-P beta-lysylation protein EpmB